MTMAREREEEGRPGEVGKRKWWREKLEEMS